ncbi:MAG: hypothetical protein ABI216_10545 [Devosia sp.]
MTEISPVRLYALRLAFLIFAGGLILVKWPMLISHDASWPPFEGVTGALLGGLALMALLGLRYPLQMLPILLFEVTWKIIWGALIFLPLWQAGKVDEVTANIGVNCLFVLLFLPLIPWDYVFANFVRAPSTRWRHNKLEPAVVPASAVTPA